jgi:hypothetical protein
MKEDEMVRHVAGMEEVRNAHSIFMWTPAGTKPLRGTERSWEKSIKFDDDDEVVCKVIWIQFSQDWDQRWAVENTVVASKSRNFFIIWAITKRESPSRN